ncbi:hypothetical protein GCM10009104_19570 [Marinobacterium maritimum]|uniref:HTH marR-type domain-containing protein n=1 Tax=Marinobacterium maritimum TaxID=500162 RepID=A0ABN1I6I1_9GAMM
MQTQLAAAGLTDSIWAPLVHLRESGGGLVQKELAFLVGVDGSSLVRVLDILEREGLIERRRDAGDGRAKRIYLTQPGEARVNEILQEIGKAEAAMLSELTDDEIAAMFISFEKINCRMSELEAERTEEPA